jgi:3-phenylpropionate/trans-cinnamate dioxygenase ferredoxin reductase component
VRVVVVGASLGGLRTAEQLRAAGWTDEIVLVGAEPHLPYTRPPLTKEALADGVDHVTLEFRRRKSVADVDWRLGRTAVTCSLEQRSIELDGGERLGWDGLVIATGLRSRRLAPEVAGGLPEHGAGRHAVRTLEDAAELRRWLRPGARLVVLGAGFIGCEVAATAIGRGCSVHVVAPEAVPMQRPLGQLVGHTLQRRHEARGVSFHLGRLPVEVEAIAAGNGGGTAVGSVRLDDGTRLAADVVVEALGSLPNVEWLAGNDLDLSNGVLCDSRLRALTGGGAVPRADVVAVGDVARFPNALYDEVPRRVEHWNMPTEMARRAGPVLAAGLVGGELPPAAYAPMPSFWSDQYDVRLQSFGSPDLGTEVRLLEGDLEGEFAVGYLRDDRLVGVAGVGLMPRLLELRAEIADASALS